MENELNPYLFIAANPYAPSSSSWESSYHELMGAPSPGEAAPIYSLPGPVRNPHDYNKKLALAAPGWEPKSDYPVQLHVPTPSPPNYPLSIPSGVIQEDITQASSASFASSDNITVLIFVTVIILCRA